MQIIVLGMHRSGTSVLTQLLTEMGCYFGREDDLLKADEWNPTGYWERRDVIALNDRVLRGAGARWWRVSKLDFKRIGRARRRQLVERTRALVGAMEPHRPWVIKDPRLCLTLPLWKSALDAPMCVLIYRSPLEVARSLHKRDRLPMPLGIALWEFYNLNLLRHTRKLSRLLLSYRDLTRRPVPETRRLYRWLEPRVNGSLRLPTEEKTRSVVDPRLRRHQISPAFERRYLSPPQIRLAEAMDDRSALDWQRMPPLSAVSADLLQAFDRTDTRRRTLEKELKRERRRYVHEVGTRNRALEEGSKVRDEMKAAIEDLQARLDAECETRACLRTERDQMRQTIETLRAPSEDVERLEARLAEVAGELQAARRLLAEERDFHAEDLRLRDQKLVDADTLRRELLETAEALMARERVTRHVLIEEREWYGVLLSSRERIMADMENAFSALAARVEGDHRALADADRLRQEMQKSFDALKDQQRATIEDLEAHRRALEPARQTQREMQEAYDALKDQQRVTIEDLEAHRRALEQARQTQREMQEAYDVLKDQQRATIEDLEAHRRALEEARQDYRSTEAALVAERRRFEEELRLRERSVVAYEAQLENFQRDHDTLREHLSRELELREKMLAAKDRVIGDFARSAENLQELVQRRERELRTLEATTAQLARENRLALPLVVPVRYWLRLMDWMRTHNR